MTSNSELVPADQELVASTLQDRHNYVLLVERYDRRIRGYLRRLTNFSEDDLEDLTQEVFIKAYRNLTSYESRYPFDRWLYSIAHNEAISAFRHHTSRPITVSLEGDPTEDPNDLSLADILRDQTDLPTELNRSQMATHVKSAMQKLSPEYRSILILRYFEDRNYDEISDILKKPAGTVATLLHRAKHELKKHLIDYYEA